VLVTHLYLLKLIEKGKGRKNKDKVVAWGWGWGVSGCWHCSNNTRESMTQGTNGQKEKWKAEGKET